MNTLNMLRTNGVRELELFDISLLSRLHAPLTGMGFSVQSCHFASPYITGNWAPMRAFGMKVPPASYTFDHVVEDARKYGLEYLVFPYIFPEDRGGLEAFRRLAEKLNRAGEKCREAGIQLCYHFHSYDFQPMEKSSPMQVILKETQADLLGLEADTFWLSLAGIEPVAFIRQYADRIRLAHLADIAANSPTVYRAVTLPATTYQPPGQGSIDFGAVISALRQANVQKMFIDLAEIKDPLNKLEESLTYLRSF
jgi:sugar phosphate isomerase/epimerase